VSGRNISASFVIMLVVTYSYVLNFTGLAAFHITGLRIPNIQQISFPL